MHGRELYGRYRQLVAKLADSDKPEATWFPELRAIIDQLELEAAGIERFRAKRLFQELGDQFEQEALQTANEHRRKVLMAAVKLLD
jgi:hypothetical protein